MSLPEVQAVVKKYPGAYCVSDSGGCYIIPGSDDRQTVLGKGRKPEKAWHNAWKNLKKREGSKARPQTPLIGDTFVKMKSEVIG